MPQRAGANYNSLPGLPIQYINVPPHPPMNTDALIIHLNISILICIGGNSHVATHNVAIKNSSINTACVIPPHIYNSNFID